MTTTQRRVAVAGASGRIGALVCRTLDREGHQAVPISRGHGVDLTTGEGLPEVLGGVDTVIDVTNSTALEESETIGFFTATTNHLLEAEKQAGVRHHVALSIAGVSRVSGNAHYAGKRAQEAAIEAGGVPFSIVPATQFHDFAEMVGSWTESDGVVTLPPLLLQPVAPQDVAAVLVRVALGDPVGRHVDVAGPGPEDMVDMARRTLAARGRAVRLVPSWHTGIFGEEMAGDVLLAAKDAEIAPTTFDAWISEISEG